ncbi:MAG: cytochrome c [Bacteroidetes bacterium]|nr:MAG: cytochrome c [Bacteroidota bacterium]
MFYRITRCTYYHIIRVAVVFIAFAILACNGSKTSEVTYAEHIAPIIQQNCVKCHQKGEAGPFNLVSYEDVAKKAKLVRYVTENRIMPPWPADPTYSTFVNEMYLTDEQIALIKTWVEQGCKPGDTASLPAFSDSRQENLGKPDLVVKVPTIDIPGNNTDLFAVVKIPYEIPYDTFVRAIEFVCGNKKLVHHMNGHLIQFDPSKKKNLHTGKSWVNQDQSNSQTIHKELGLLHDDGTYAPMTPSVSNYLPGALFMAYPKEIGGYRFAKKGAFYLNDMHYGPTPIPATDSSYFNIYFSPTPPKRPVAEFQMGTLGVSPVVPDLIVPPNKVQTFRIQTTLPEDISVITIVPHMHLIGKKYLAYAVKPSGDTIPLIRINNWDFRWQYFYQFKQLLRLPRGTTIYVEGVYDNTASNPNNPFSPPREIREKNGSMKTTDEMFQLIVTYVPYQAGDEKISLAP